MDVKNDFLHGSLKEDMYVCQPEDFIDADHASHVYKLKKALYGLKQAPRAWYDELSKFLQQNHFNKVTIDPTLFIRRFNDDILVAQPTEKHLKEVKQIFRYLWGTINMGLWYTKDSGFKLTGYSEVDYAGCRDSFKSTSGGTQFLGEKLFRRRPTAKGVGLRVMDSHAGNHPEDGFIPLETIRRLLVVIGRRSHSGFKGEAFEPERMHCGLSAKELNEFFSSYPIPSENDVILPTSTQTIFDAPPEMAFRNFIYIEDDNDLAFLPKEPSPRFGESPKTDVFIVHLGSVAARIKERKYKTRGGSSRPPVKRKLAFGSSSSHVVCAKTSASKDDALILSISDDDEGEFLVHSVLSEGIDLLIHPLSSLYAVVDNAVNRRACEFLQVIKKMSGEADVIKAREISCEEECEELRVKCEAAMDEFDQNLVVLALREKISSLTADVKEHKEEEKAKLEAVKESLRREVEELKQDKRDVVSKVVPYAAMEWVHSDELGRLVGTLVSSAITYGRWRAYEQVDAMNEPFDLSKAKGYHSSYKKEHTQASNDFATATFP
ncbi:retrovirus-related pol polyprotein from transposon TNT 1-94 [Tanacetum coccineum]